MAARHRLAVMKLDTLETPRLRIRQFEAADLDRVRRFRRDVFGLDEPPARAQSWLDWTIASYREMASLGQPPYADYAVVLRAGGQFIGSVGIVPALAPWGALKGNAADSRLNPEIGLFWGILPQYRRRGFASEAAGALLEALFADLNARQVVATTERDNHASQRVMEKIGMKRYLNSNPEPRWLQVVGFIANPRSK